MSKKLNKTKAMKQLARDASDQMRVFVDRDELLSDPWTNDGQLAMAQALLDKHLGGWRRLMVIKYGPQVRIRTFADFDIDYNRYRIGGYDSA